MFLLQVSSRFGVACVLNSDASSAATRETHFVSN